MKKAVYLFLSVILAATLLLTLPACGKEETPAAPTQTDAKSLAVISAMKYGKKVNTSMENYTLTCGPETEADADTPAFDADAGTYDGYGGETAARRFTVTLQKNGASEPVFRILLSLKMPAELSEGGFELTGKPVARRGDKWLFTVHYATGDADAYFIYHAASSALFPLGEYSSALFFDDRMFMTPAVYSEQALHTAYLFDWDGETVASFPDVFDMTLYHDAVYMIRQFEPSVLESIPVSSLTNHDQVPQAERICDFGIYDAFFYEGDKLVIQPLSGGYPTTCPIEDAASTLQELQNGSHPDNDTVTEACDAFSVSLPARWEGKYTCSTYPDMLTFRHKAETESGGEGFLFSLCLTDPPEDFYRAGLGDFFAFCNIAEITDADGDTRYLYMSYQENADGFSPENAEEAQEMLGFLNGIEYKIDVPAGSRMEVIDYGDKIGAYTPDGDATAVYRFRVDRAFHNILTCTIGFSRTEETSFWGDCKATIYMYGDRGVLTWEDEEYDFYGSGVAEFWDDGRVLLSLEQSDGIRDIVLNKEAP